MRGDYCFLGTTVDMQVLDTMILCSEFFRMRSKSATEVVHHKSIHWRFQSNNNPTEWGKHGGGIFFETVAIELINPQRKKEEERGKYSGLSMWQVYTQVYIAVVDSLHFSQSH